MAFFLEMRVDGLEIPLLGDAARIRDCDHSLFVLLCELLCRVQLGQQFLERLPTMLEFRERLARSVGEIGGMGGDVAPSLTQETARAVDAAQDENLAHVLGGSLTPRGAYPAIYALVELDLGFER
jgi:hypothetical protein